MRRHLPGIVAIASAGVLIVSAAAAANEPSGTAEPAGSGSAPTAEVVEFSPESRWQERFNIVATQLEFDHPEEFGGAEINADGRSGWIGFADEPPVTALDVIHQLPEVEVRSGMGFTMREADEFGRVLFNTATSEVGDAASVTVYREGNATEYLVVVGPSTPGSTVAPEVVDRVRDLATTMRSGVLTAAVVVVPEPVAISEVFDGGRVVANTCTGSFSIKRNGGPELGVLTAGHCPGTGAYDGVANAFYPVYPYSLATTDVIPGGDFRWNHSKTMFTGMTYVGAPTQPRRAFASSAHASTGSSICKYGRMTGYSCGTVRRLGLYAQATVPAADGGGTYRVGPMRGLDVHITTGGDSGGPWFFNFVGYGVHYGAVNGGSAWSTLPYALDRLGVSLWTG